ncbi:hypothetical protein TWF281_006749 [Arthrobotrys megalospora]
MIPSKLLLGLLLTAVPALAAPQYQVRSLKIVDDRVQLVTVTKGNKVVSTITYTRGMNMHGTGTGVHTQGTGLATTTYKPSMDDDRLSLSGTHTPTLTEDEPPYTPSPTTDMDDWDPTDDMGSIDPTATPTDEEDMEPTGMDDMPTVTTTVHNTVPTISTIVRPTTIVSVSTVYSVYSTVQIVTSGVSKTYTVTTAISKPYTITVSGMPTTMTSDLPTSMPTSASNILMDKSRYMSYSKIDNNSLVYIANFEFAEYDKWRKTKLEAVNELRNSMVLGKEYFERAAIANTPKASCTAPAYAGGQPEDPLIYCNHKSRYGVRLNNLMDTAWTGDCLQHLTNAVWLSEAVTSGSPGIPEGQVPDDYASANKAQRTKFFKHAELPMIMDKMDSKRSWQPKAQVYKGSPLQLVYISLEEPGCPDEWKDV